MNPTATPTKREVLQNKIDSGQSIFRGGIKPPELYGNTPTISPTNIDTTIPNVIPAKALSGNVSYNDLRLKRNNLEQKNLISQADTQRHNDLLGRANSPLTGSPITNPDAYINELLLNRPTKTQIELDTLGTEQASQTRGFASELTSAQEKASKQFGVGEAQTTLGETQSRIADRTVKLRQALRDFETNAEQRGVAREFVQSAKGKLQADAAAELADLSIIENAQLGNLQQAQAEVDRVIENKKQSFLYENQAIQQEIDNLNKKDDRESKLKATQLQIALDTRKQNIETQLANEKEQRGYMAEAAANGADTATLDAIRNAKSPQEALFVAGDFIGKLDREAKLANLKLRQDELGLARDKFESESTTFGSGTVTLPDGKKAVVKSDGTITPVSEIDFNDPEEIDALPVSNITKAVMQGFAKTKDLTPTQKGAVLSELQAIGFNPNTYVTKKLNSLVEKWSSVPEESKGYVQGLKFWESKTNPDVADFESQKTLLTREIARLFDVGVLSDQDVKSYKDAMPSRQDANIDVVLKKASGISSAATGQNIQNVGKRIKLNDGKEAIVGIDGNTLIDPKTGKELE